MDMQDFIDRLSKEEHHLFMCLADDTRHSLLRLPANKRRAIFALSEENLHKWEEIHRRLHRKKKRYRDLEEALDKDFIQPRDLNEANSNLRSLEKEIDDLEKEEQQILSSGSSDPGGTGKKYDRFARPGVVSIRPVLKGGYTPSKLRQVRKGN
jgi:hypothetical protein